MSSPVFLPKGKEGIAADHQENSESSDIEKSPNLDIVEDTTPGAFIWLCAAATAAIGGLLFGYDTGVISGVLVVIGKDLDNRVLSSSEKELITALCAAGALCGTIVAGATADKYGRRRAIWFASVLFTLGAIIQATSYTIAQMSVGRFLIGLGVGSASTVCECHFSRGFTNETPDCASIHWRNLSVTLSRTNDLCRHDIRRRRFGLSIRLRCSILSCSPRVAVHGSSWCRPFDSARYLHVLVSRVPKATALPQHEGGMQVKNKSKTKSVQSKLVYGIQKPERRNFDPKSSVGPFCNSSKSPSTHCGLWIDVLPTVLGI
jgi:Sugar (and other) transporter